MTRSKTKTTATDSAARVAAAKAAWSRKRRSLRIQTSARFTEGFYAREGRTTNTEHGASVANSKETEPMRKRSNVP